MPDIFIKGEGGGIFQLSLPLHETIEDKLRKGLVTRVDQDGNPFVQVEGEDPVPGLPDARPARNAPKLDWVGWAVAQGCDVTEAELMTKADLVDTYGQDPAPEPEPSGDDGDTSEQSESE